MKLNLGSLFAKLNLITVLVNLAGYALMAIVLYTQLNASARTQTQSFVEATGHQVTSAVSSFTARYEWNAEILSTDQDINSFLNTRHDKNQLTYALFVQYKNIGSRFSQLLSADPGLLSVCLMKNDPNLLEDGKYVVRASGLFSQLLEQKKALKNRWLSTEGSLYLANTPRLASGSLLVMQLREEDLYDSIGVGGEGMFDYYVLDNENKVLSSSQRERLGEVLPGSLLPLLSANGVVEVAGNIMCYSAKVGDLGVLVAYDVSGIRADNARTLTGLMLLVVLAMLVSIGAMTWMGRSFSRNIRRILKKLGLMREGGFAQTPTLKTADELQLIDESICDLGDNVVRLNQSLMDAAQRQKALELRFLQMQINRHFLHNSLSSLRWMAVRSGQEELSGLMESLISFYKVTLSQDDILSLQEEVTLVENYVRLENVIHLGDLRFHCDIPDELLSIPVCKMTLQPFVENAIHHGKIQGTPLDIWLTAEEMAGSVILRVEDNGHGMTDERATELKNILQGSKSGGDSIAMYNTLSRLRGLYGPDVDISIMVRQGTAIEMMLPPQEE